MPPLTLGTDFTRSGGMSFAGGRVPVHLDAPLVASMRRLAKQLRVSTFTVLMAGFCVVMARHSRSTLIPVAVPSGGRSAETENLIGNFTPG